MGSRRWVPLILSVLFVLILILQLVVTRLVSDVEATECRTACTSYQHTLNFLAGALAVAIFVVGFAAFGTWWRSRDRLRGEKDPPLEGREG